MKRNALLILLLTVLVVVFHRVPFNDFTNLDDPSHFDNNPYFEPLSLENTSRVWTNPHLLYIPMTYSVWAVAAALSGKTPDWQVRTLSGVPRDYEYYPFWFHFISLVFHLANVVLVFLLLEKLGISGLAALAGALTFGLHPVQVEAVAWASALKDTLSSFFLLSALVVVFSAPPPWSPRRLTATAALFLLALLSKPTTLVFPALVLILSASRPRLNFRDVLPGLALWGFILIPFWFLTVQIQSTDSLQFKAPEFFERILIALDTLGFYLIKIILPAGYALDYGRSPATALASSDLSFHIGLALGFLSLLSWATWRYRRNLALTGALWALVAVFPVLGFKPFSFQTTSTVADRYLYVPLLGLALTIAWTLQRRPRWAPYFFAIALLWGGMSLRQTYFWRDTPTLFRHALTVNPRSWLIENNFGAYSERQGKWDDAIGHYTRSAELKPQPVAFNNLGALYMLVRKFPQAKAAYESSLALNPLSPLDLNGRGYACLSLGDRRCAEESFARAVQLDPTLGPARAGLLSLEHKINGAQNKNKTN